MRKMKQQDSFASSIQFLVLFYSFDAITIEGKRYQEVSKVKSPVIRRSTYEGNFIIDSIITFCLV